MIKMNEYSEMIKEHPHFLLTSENPVTWQGFLPINNNKQIQVKLTAPSYPSVINATVRFGRHISLMHDTDFSIKLRELLDSAVSVSSFMRQLQRLMEIYLKKKECNLNENIPIFNSNSLLQELKTALKLFDVAILGNNNLTAIKLMYKDISIVLKPATSAHNSWTLLSSDLPKLESWEPLENSIPTLTEAAKVLKTRVNALQETWQDLKHIDECCWVLDPINPKPSHLYRRIHLNPALSLMINFDKLEKPTIQDMQLLGSDSQVVKYRDIMNENWDENWSEDKSIVDNIQQVLGIYELPRPPSDPEDQNDDDAILDDNACCICFSLELDDNDDDDNAGQTPEVICDNSKCRRYFHTVCLYQWLESVAGNEVVFNRLNGTCPNCKEAISCPVVTTKNKNDE